jgi:magnesium transporter
MSKRSRRQRNRLAHQAAGIEAGPFEIDRVPENEVISTSIRVTTYDAVHVDEQDLKDVQQLRDFVKQGKTAWVRVLGLKDSAKIKEIADVFGMHHLAVEDVLDTHQRAQVGQFGNTFFLITHLVEDHGTVAAKQLSLFFNENYVVTFQDEPIFALEAVHDRIKNHQEMVRAQRADYLVYLLLDAVVDSYFPVLEEFGERLDDLEEAAIADPSRKTMAAIHSLKRQLLIMRRAIWPLREAINQLLRDGSSALSAEAHIHLRDCYDEVVRVIDFIETYRELGADLMDVYLSSVSNRLNEIMKVLTIITVVFAPPTLIAAIYGMNFDSHRSPFNMPECNWYFGYPYALILMLYTSVMIYSYLKRRGFIDLPIRRVRKPDPGTQ